MADEETKPEEAAAAPAGGGKKKLIIIIVAVVLLLGIGVGAFFALKGGESAEDEEGAEASEEEAAEEGEAGEEAALPAAIVPFEPFIVNLQVKGSFLKTSIQMELSQPELPKEFDNDVPKIRDSIIKVLSSKTASEILSVEGKDKLSEEIRTVVNELLGGTEIVTKIYFTDFIVQ